MTLETLLQLARQRFDDKVEPYRWSDEELVAFANEAVREVCRRAHLIIDETTDSTCRIAVVAGKPIYNLDPKVIGVRSCYLGAYIRGELSWDAASNSLLDENDGFVAAGFEEGDQISVFGFSETGNNGIFTISSVEEGAIVVEETGISDEESEDVVVEVKETPLVKATTFTLDADYPGWKTRTGTPWTFVESEDDTIRLVDIPEDPNTLHLTVSRYPLEDMELEDKATAVPEIPAHYHFDLIDGMGYFAYMTDDADSEDLKKMLMYESNLTDKFGPRPSAKAEQFKKRYPRELHVRPVKFGC